MPTLITALTTVPIIVSQVSQVSQTITYLFKKTAQKLSQLSQGPNLRKNTDLYLQNHAHLHTALDLSYTRVTARQRSTSAS